MLYIAGMEKQDARTLSVETQEQIRKQAIRLRKQGMAFGKIAQVLGVNRNLPSKWWHAYASDGMDAIRSKTRGRKPGEKRKLSTEQERDIQSCIKDKMPDQYKMTFALWTRQAVGELIFLRTGIRMPVRTIGTYLKRWGFTPQKPLKRAYEQRPEAVKKWLEESYPEIQARAKEEGAEIHWGDETGIRSDTQHGRSYSPKGQTPVIRLSAKRTSLNMISAISNQGTLRFMTYDGTLNAKVLKEFLLRLIRSSAKKVFLILDNLRVHHAKVVMTWLEKYKEKIEIFFLPSYSPELNPDEYLNCDLKAGVHSKPPARTAKGLRTTVISHMRKLQKSPNRIKKYFEHKSIRYAA